MAYFLRSISSCCLKMHPINLSCTIKYRMKDFPRTSGTNTSAFMRYFSPCRTRSGIFVPFVRIVLSKHLEYWITFSCHLGNESSYVVEPSHEAPDFFLGSRRRQTCIARTLSGSISIPFLLTTNPSNFLNVASKVHFVGLSFN